MTAEKKKAQQVKNKLCSKRICQAKSLDKAGKQKNNSKNNNEEKAPG
jgi:hypothetical protein